MIIIIIVIIIIILIIIIIICSSSISTFAFPTASAVFDGRYSQGVGDNKISILGFREVYGEVKLGHFSRSEEGCFLHAYSNHTTPVAPGETSESLITNKQTVWPHHRRDNRYFHFHSSGHGTFCLHDNITHST